MASPNTDAPPYPDIFGIRAAHWPEGGGIGRATVHIRRAATAEEPRLYGEYILQWNDGKNRLFVDLDQPENAWVVGLIPQVQKTVVQAAATSRRMPWLPMMYCDPQLPAGRRKGVWVSVDLHTYHNAAAARRSGGIGLEVSHLYVWMTPMGWGFDLATPIYITETGS